MTCNGFFEGGRNVSEDAIVNCLTAEGTKKLPKHLAGYGAGYQQLSLFDTGLLQRDEKLVLSGGGAVAARGFG